MREKQETYSVFFNHKWYKTSLQKTAVPLRNAETNTDKNIFTIFFDFEAMLLLIINIL